MKRLVSYLKYLKNHNPRLFIRQSDEYSGKITRMPLDFYPELYKNSIIGLLGIWQEYINSDCSIQYNRIFPLVKKIWITYGYRNEIIKQVNVHNYGSIDKELYRRGIKYNCRFDTYKDAYYCAICSSYSF